MTMRNDAEERVLGQQQRHARLARAGRKRKPAPVRLIHQRGQVFAGQGQRRVRSLVARGDLVVGDDAVDQHVGDAVDGRHQNARA